MQEQNPTPDNPPEIEQKPAAEAPPAEQAVAEPHQAADLMPSLEESLRQAELKAEEHHDAWLRAKAETENVRRRAQEDIAKASKFAAEKFATAMLPVKDSLEAALAVENQSVEKLREGVELTLKQLVSAFESARVVEENPLGATASAARRATARLERAYTASRDLERAANARLTWDRLLLELRDL